MTPGRPITPHDPEIRRRISEGESNTEIARALGISRATVLSRRQKMALPHPEYVRGVEDERRRVLAWCRSHPHLSGLLLAMDFEIGAHEGVPQ